NAMQIALHILRSLLCAYLTISLMEYFVHRWLMHRPHIARFFGNSYLQETFDAHIDHHCRCYDIFDHEEGPCGLKNLVITHSMELLASAVPALIWWFLDPWTACMIPVFALLHGVLWSAVHTEMHRPVKTWFSNTAVFRYLHKHHFLHHR